MTRADIPRVASAARGIRHVFIRNLELPAHIGVYRQEEGRSQKVRINLDIPHWMILKIDRVARRKGLPRQAQIKEWLSQKLKEEEPSAI